MLSHKKQVNSFLKISYVVIYATHKQNLKAQFMQKLSSIEAELKKRRCL